jgi:hypothetical protein
LKIKSHERPKIIVTHNKKLLYAIFVVFIALIALLIWLNIAKENQTKCRVDEDCIKQRISCCSCTMGGEEVCMTKQNATLQRESIVKNCQNNIFCTAVFNCKETKCLCNKGECVEQ